MKSMTGYGRAATALGEFTLTVQVSSVNRKSLDLTVRLPREWEGGLESEVTAEVAGRWSAARCTSTWN